MVTIKQQRFKSELHSAENETTGLEETKKANGHAR